MAFRPQAQGDLAPAGASAKLAANMAVLRTLRDVREQGRPVSTEQQAVLARWSGWGSLPQVFDTARPELEQVRAEARELLGAEGFRAASRTTLNAHYTDAALAGAVWDVLGEAGFASTTGWVLEPGCGSGTFLGLAPAAATRLVGIELDPTTAAIAQALYPHADVRAESFADSRLPEGGFDLTIGNVPFGKIALHDPVHNPAGHSLHNHFIVKSLHLTRPGGVVAVLTSHWTMDATNPAARREIAALGELVAAVRLPSTAHHKAAGTTVLTDLLVLRRHAAGHQGVGGEAVAWERAVPLDADVGAVGPAEGDIDAVAAEGRRRQRPAVNEAFGAHPAWIVGAQAVRQGQYGPEVHVVFDGDVEAIAAQLAGRLRQALSDTGHGPGMRPLFEPTGPDARQPLLRPDAAPGSLEAHLDIDRAGGFTVVARGQLLAHQVPASQARELTALLELREVTVQLLQTEAASRQDSAELGGLRTELNRCYDAYTARYGPVNRVTTRRTGRIDPDTGQERLARIRPPQGGFRGDPHAPAVYALEEYDATTGTARKAAIMNGRVIAPRPQRLGADAPADALAICLDSHGQVRLNEIARLLGVDEPQARHALGTLVFVDPEQGQRLVPAPEYLSGNVRAKLRAAEDAAEHDQTQHWQANIAALREVIPADLGPAEIDARLGASWIAADIVAQFLRELLDDPSVQVENPGGSVWAVKGIRHSVLATTTYGTGRISAIDLAQAVLEQRQIRITDELEDGRRVLNLTETVSAQDKAAVLGEAFTDWIWQDPDRAERLAQTYNDTFNAIVLRNYDGSQALLPGLAVTFTPRPHQLAAVARMVAEPTALLAHDVGAGKTASVIIGVSELRRLQMVQKPAVVVPNHMLEQFTREWLQLYPQARVLAAGTEDLAGAKRRLLVGRVATGDWDAVILSRSAFERLPMAPGAQKAYLDSQLEQMRAQLENSRSGGGLTVKRLEGALARAEERLDALTDGARDPGVTFELTGIDYVVVDEAHGYKNLRTPSNIVGVAIEGSQRASDLDMKISYLRERAAERGSGRVATFATATPIANSVAEAYVMQRYLRPDVLTDAGITDFDTWAATFGEVTTTLELSPDGSNYRMQSRFAKFRNVPELLRMWHLSADIKTAEDLQLPVPALTFGAARTVVVPPSPQLREMMAELSERADRVQSRLVDPAEDNMLRVATHGRMAALDLRLLQRQVGDPTKLVTAADRIAGIHHREATRTYPGSDVPGSLQLVFCDLGTPRQGWNVYDELRQLLLNRDVPADKIAFVHRARNDREKGELFAACRTGQVGVLLGSTERMGVGTNVQARAVALHHLDCPWRPADLAQREGRILRQGNNNDTVEIVRYVSEGSFDAYLWQTVERKARFIGQVMRGTLDVREIEDIGETALSYSEVKALATGDPRILDKARADTDAARLERLERAHHRTRTTLHATVERSEQRLPVLDRELAQLDRADAARRDTRGELFTMTVAGQRFTARPDAASALRNTLLALPPATGGNPSAPVPVGQLAGLTVLATALRHPEPHLRLEFADTPRTGTNLEPAELVAHRPLGLISRLEHRAGSLPTIRADIERERDRLLSERDRAGTELTRPFPHRQALAAAQARSAQLTAELTAPQPATQASPPDDVGAFGPALSRWHRLCAGLDRRLVDDPHWHALSAALDRVALAGVDVEHTLTSTTAQGPLPDEHPARALHYRLVDRCPAALTPTPLPASLDPPGRDDLTTRRELARRPPQPSPRR